jgi:hypothetical protein
LIHLSLQEGGNANQENSVQEFTCQDNCRWVVF